MSAKPPLLGRWGERKGFSPGRIALAAAVLGYFALLILVPTVELARRAFEGGLGAWTSMFASKEFQSAFRMTIGITLVVTLLNTLFGTAFSLVVTRHRFWGRQFADGLLDLAFAVSPVVTGLMLVVAYGPRSWIGGAFDALGLPIVFAPPGMVLASLFVTLPFVVREVTPVLREIGYDQEEAAKTLGAGRWKVFFRVTLPSIRWGLVYGAILTAGRCLGEYGALLVVSGNMPGRTQTATLYIHDQLESVEREGPRRGYIAALLLAMISLVLLLISEFVRKRYSHKDE